MIRIDTIEVSRKFVNAGFNKEQADVVAQELFHYITEEESKDIFVNKNDLLETRNELKDDISAVRTELKKEISDVRTELKEEISDVRTELKEKISDVRTELHRLINHQTKWFVGLFTAYTALILSLKFFV